MAKANDRISTWQTVVLLVSIINGISVLNLPRILADDVGPDGWASLIIAHIVAFVLVFMMIKLGERFPGQTFIEYSQVIVGKYIGLLFGLVAVVFWIIACASVVRIFADVLKLFILTRTPIEILIIFMLAVAAYALRHGIEPIGRIVEILFPILFLLIATLAIVSLTEIDLSNFRPILASPPLEIVIAGVRHGTTQLQGIEMFLLLLPFMLTPSNAMRAAVVGLSVNLVLRTTLFVATIGVFGLHVTDLQWPVGTLSKFLELPGGVLERFDVVFMTLWITIAFSSVMGFYYFATLALSRLMSFKEHSLLTLPLLPIIYGISLIPSNALITTRMAELDSALGGFIALVVPALLWAVALIRGKKGKQNKKKGK